MDILDKEKVYAYNELAKELLVEHDAISLVSAALKMLTKEPNHSNVKLTDEAPLRTKKIRIENRKRTPRKVSDGAKHQSFNRKFEKSGKRGKSN